MAKNTKDFNFKSVPSNSIPTAITKAAVPNKNQIPKSAVTVKSGVNPAINKPALPPRPGAGQINNQQVMSNLTTKPAVMRQQPTPTKQPQRIKDDLTHTGLSAQAQIKTNATLQTQQPNQPPFNAVTQPANNATPRQIQLPPQYKNLEKLEALWNSFNLIIEAVDFYQGFINQTAIARQLWASKLNQLTSEQQGEVRQLLATLDGLNQTMRSLSGLAEYKSKLTAWLLKAGTQSGSAIKIELPDAQGKQQVVSIMDAKKILKEFISAEQQLPAIMVRLVADGSTESISIEGACNKLEEAMTKPATTELLQAFAKEDLFKNTLSHIAAISAWHTNNSRIADDLNKLDKQERTEQAAQQASSFLTGLKNSLGLESDTSINFKISSVPATPSEALTRDNYSGKLNGFGAKFKLVFEGISKNFATAAIPHQLAIAQNIATTVHKLVGGICNQFIGMLPKQASQSAATYQVLAESNEQQAKYLATLQLAKTLEDLEDKLTQLSQSKVNTEEIRSEYSKLAGKLLDANLQYPDSYQTWQKLLNALAVTGNDNEKTFIQDSIAPQLINQNITDQNIKTILYEAQFLIADLEADNNERRRQTKHRTSNESLLKTEEARMEGFAKAVEALAKVRHASEAEQEAGRLMRYLDRLATSVFEKQYLRELKQLNAFFDFSSASEKKTTDQQSEQLTQHLKRVNALKTLLPDNIVPTNQLLAQLLAEEALGNKDFLTACMDIKYQQLVANSSKNFNFTQPQIEVLSVLAAEGHYQSLNALGNYYIKQKHDPANASLFFELAYYQAKDEQQRQTILTQLKQASKAGNHNKHWEAKLQDVQQQASDIQKAEVSLVKAEALIIGLETAKRPIFEFFGAKKQSEVVRPQMIAAQKLLHQAANLPKFKQQCLSLVARLEKVANNSAEKDYINSVKDSVTNSKLSQQQHDRVPASLPSI